MKKVIFIHGMSSTITAVFGKGVKNSLDKLQIKNYEPVFELHPNISFQKWTNEMDKYRELFDDDTVFVCHSLGTNFIIRYLADNKIKCKGIISVAGGVVKSKSEVPNELAYLYEFAPNDQEFAFCKQNVPYKYNIFNKDDHVWSLEQMHRYTKKLGAKAIELPYGKHFGRSSGITDLPIVTQIIKQDIFQNYLGDKNETLDNLRQ